MPYAPINNEYFAMYPEKYHTLRSFLLENPDLNERDFSENSHETVRLICQMSGTRPIKKNMTKVAPPNRRVAVAKYFCTNSIDNIKNNPTWYGSFGLAIVQSLITKMSIEQLLDYCSSETADYAQLTEYFWIYSDNQSILEFLIKKWLRFFSQRRISWIPLLQSSDTVDIYKLDQYLFYNIPIHVNNAINKKSLRKKKEKEIDHTEKVNIIKKNPKNVLYKNDYPKKKVKVIKKKQQKNIISKKLTHAVKLESNNQGRISPMGMKDEVPEPAKASILSSADFQYQMLVKKREDSALSYILKGCLDFFSNKLKFLFQK